MCPQPAVLSAGPPAFWEVPVTGAEHGGKVYGNNTVAVLDTGAPVAWVPPGPLQSGVWQSYGRAGDQGQDGQTPHYLFPCSSASQLTDITFTIGGGKYAIPGEAMSSFDHNEGSTPMCSSLLVPYQRSANQQRPTRQYTVS
jgi:hypothetical protein